MQPKIPLDRAMLARFNRQIVKDQSGCWFFLTTNTADGYSRWRYRPGSPETYAHVFAYRAFVGEIPDNMQVDHKCHTTDTACPGGEDCRHRRCCNPSHLELVTGSENTKRQRHANRLKTECPQGHPLSGDNLVVWKDGRRRCRECLRSR